MRKYKTEGKKNWNEMNSEEKITYSMNEIEQILSNTINEENLGFWRVVYALSSGPKRWSELKDQTGIHEVTLSRKLKKIQKESFGIIKRTVIPAFPPRTQYELNEERGQKIEELKWNVLGINSTQDMIKDFLIASIRKDLSTEELLEGLLKAMEIWILASLDMYVKNPIKAANIIASIWDTTFSTILIMQLFWGCYSALVSSRERQEEASMLLSRMIKEKMESIRELNPERRELITRALGPLLQQK